jgi:putative chitinase
MDYQEIKNLITKLAPTGKLSIVDDVARYIAEYAPKYGITGKRLQMFIAQAAHETAGFKTLTEYATGAAYEGRLDLGNSVKGDGVKFKGRGIFQVTGRGNYKGMGKVLMNDANFFVNNPEKLAEPKYAVLTAFIYWNDRNLNSIADKPDTWRSNPVKIAGVVRQLNPFEYITYRINGGQNGATDRLQYFVLAQRFILDNPGLSLGVLLIFALITFLLFQSSKL